MFVYREEYYLDKSEPTQRDNENQESFNERFTKWQDKRNSAEGKAEIIISKQRHGPTGIIQVQFEAKSLDGHLFIIKMLLESYVYLPIGIILNFTQISDIAVNTFGNMLYLAALISLPIVGGLLLIQCSIGIITRSAPSLNLFSFGFPIALISVFIFLYAGVGPVSDAFSDLTGTAINLIYEVLHSSENGS